MCNKKLLLFLLIFSLSARCFSQDLIEKKEKLADKMTAVYTVLKSDEQVKDGLYQEFYRRKHLIVSGIYKKGRKTGVWRYFNPKGVLMQTYNVDKDSIVYEAFESRASGFDYLVDEELTDSDKTTKPLKIGGRYYGYLPYLAIYKTPFISYYWGSGLYEGKVELLISPLGRLADMKVTVMGPDLLQGTRLSLKLLKEEDKQFVPATINHKPVICRIIIHCRVDGDGGLVLFDDDMRRGVKYDPPHINYGVDDDF
ncbi:hypothetical protein [Mucilaginibacter sp.]|jgi:hypothetical protein|uniref:hypothetical protein n=1 Tax=Mucilaginibacter sp. TaxID=1882438 RepID=UPI002BA66B9D|nr:hypothetical protein [Mucilaginibacter sp.]HTI58077.1 hypothetical protein [Mucilaginibacter sp.]